MKKTLIALALFGATASIAHAQSNVQVYGLIDTGFIKESGVDTRMGHNYESNLGFKGYEDLGNGLKATFDLARRMNINDGSKSSNYDADDVIHKRSADWKMASNVGLSSNQWGSVRFGRMMSPAFEQFYPLDPFKVYSVGASLSAFSLQFSDIISNSVRYDSPSFNGFNFNLTYSLGSDTASETYYKDNGNDGFSVTLNYDQKPLKLISTFSRLADTDRSYTWNVGGAYTFGPATMSLTYEQSRTKAGAADRVTSSLLTDDTKQQVAMAGLEYQVGAGIVKASYNYAKLDSSGLDGHVNKYALGYTYNLSKRTALYGMVAYVDSSNDLLGALYTCGRAMESSATGVQFGVQHFF